MAAAGATHSFRAVENALVVSIHDVAPSTRRAIDEILKDLASCGVKTTSLLVVPNLHHRGRTTANAPVCEWLRDLEKRGHEIVVHGYHHQRTRRSHESAVQKAVTRLYTADEGEFYDITFHQALPLITGAREQFREVGLHPRGFIAPAWLLSAEAQRAATAAGMDYTVRLRTVHDLVSGRVFRAQSLVHSVRAWWRRATSWCWNAALFRAQMRRPLVRLSIHPSDRDHPLIWRQTLRFATALAERRKVVTYAQWIDAHR